MNKYHGPGMIKHVPATKRIYRYKNKNGGRRIPQNSIGASYRHTNANGPAWEHGLGGINDVCVRLTTNSDSQLVFDLGKGNAGK